MLGIIGAMDQEVNILKEKMEVKKIDKRASMEFYVGILNGKDVVIVKCGVGKVNAAVCTQILADCYQVEAVINTGVAGSLRAEINIGDIVVSTDALQHDMDATGFGYEPAEIPLMGKKTFEANMLKEDLIWQSNMTNNLNLMQSSTIKIIKISEYVDVQKILASDTAH